MKVRTLCLAACLLCAMSCFAQEVTGAWQTSVKERGRPVRYVIHLSRANGAVTATFDVPERFDFADSVDSIAFDNSILKFRAVRTSYEGKLSADGQSIQGTWSLEAEKQNAP